MVRFFLLLLFHRQKNLNCLDNDLMPDENDEKGLTVQLAIIPTLVPIKASS